MELNSAFTKRLVFFQLILLFVLFLILNLLSEGSYGGADDIGHYRFAKYAIKYPALILDQWAKPLFTLLASPFAQFGYWGVRLFNVILGVITAILLFKIGNHLKIKRSWTLPTILFFVPVYTSMLLSGMTEILFGLVLIYAIFLVLKEKYIGSAIVISFLHLARTEGIVLWPVFIAVYMWKKQWKPLPFLLTGSLVYTIVGGLYFNDFLCLFTKMPYTGTYDIYGHGELLHFVRATKLIFGIPLTLFFVLGVGYDLYILLSRNKKEFLFSFLLILTPIMIFYSAHSYVWWKGINSLGLIRVMTCIAPLFAIYSLKGINILISVLQSTTFNKTVEFGFSRLNLDKAVLKVLPYIQVIILAFVGYIIISTPFKVMEIPVPLPEKEMYVGKAAKWFVNSKYKNRKIYVWDPYFWFFGGIESYNTPKMADGIPNRQNPEIDVKPGELVIWDAHFSAVDGRFPFENIVSNPYYKLVHAIVPKREILVFGHPYFMAFFERLDSAVNYDNFRILDSIKIASSPHYTSEILKPGIKKGHKMEPINRIKIASNVEFHDLIKTDAGSIGIQEGSILKINFRAKGQAVILVVSLKHHRDLYLYQPKEVQAHSEWSNYTVKVPLVVPKNDADIFSVYFWNKEGLGTEVDNIHIEILRECN